MIWSREIQKASKFYFETEAKGKIKLFKDVDNVWTVEKIIN